MEKRDDGNFFQRENRHRGTVRKGNVFRAVGRVNDLPSTSVRATVAKKRVAFDGFRLSGWASDIIVLSEADRLK